MKARFAAALLVATLTACDETPPAVQPSDSALEVHSARGTGMVTAIDAGAGTVTLQHGAMPEIGWPAMTMTFKAAAPLLAGVAEGDKVAFDLTVTDGHGEVTALTKQ